MRVPRGRNIRSPDMSWFCISLWDPVISTSSLEVRRRAKGPYIVSRFDTLNFNQRSKSIVEGFPGGTVVKNPPANAGDTGLSPVLGRSHMSRSNQARAPQLLSLRSRACEPHYWARAPQLLKPTCLEPVLRNKRSHRNEKPAHRNEE